MKAKDAMNQKRKKYVSTGHFTQAQYIYTFFSEIHRTISKIDHIVSQKTSLDGVRKIKNEPLYLIRTPWIKGYFNNYISITISIKLYFILLNEHCVRLRINKEIRIDEFPF